MKITPEQINLYISIAELIEAGIVQVAGGMKSVIAYFHPGKTDAELDALVDATNADAASREARRQRILDAFAAQGETVDPAPAPSAPGDGGSADAPASE